jgi:hypothetical protein
MSSKKPETETLPIKALNSRIDLKPNSDIKILLLNLSLSHLF